MDEYKEQATDLSEKQGNLIAHALGALDEAKELLLSENGLKIKNSISAAEQGNYEEACACLHAFLESVKENPQSIEICNKREIVDFLVFMFNELETDAAAIPLEILVYIPNFALSYYKPDLMKMLFCRANACTMSLPIIENIYLLFALLFDSNEKNIIDDFLENGGIELINQQIQLFPDNDLIINCITKIMQILLMKEIDANELMDSFIFIIKLEKLSNVYALTQQFIKNEDILKYMQQNGIINQIFKTAPALVDIFNTTDDQKMIDENRTIIDNGIKIFSILVSKLPEDCIIDTFCFDEIMFFVQCNDMKIVDNAIRALIEFVSSSHESTAFLLDAGVLEVLFGLFESLPFKAQNDLIELLLMIIKMMDGCYFDRIDSDMWNVIFDFIDDDNSRLVGSLYETLTALIENEYSILNFEPYREKLEEFSSDKENGVFFSLFISKLDKEIEESFDDPGADI